jgi:hypothetical protein
MSGKKSNLERLEIAYNEALGEESAFIDEAYTDNQFFVGNQWTAQEKSYLKKFGREPVVFNYTRRFIKRVGGHQRKNRLATILEPTENQDTLVAEIYDDVSKWVHKRSRAYYKISDAFEKGALVSGWNLLHPYMDYSRDPINGEIKIARRAYNTFLIAPDMVNPDLSDARYLITCDYMSKDDAKRLLPKKAKQIDELSGGLKNTKFDFVGTNHLENDEVVSFIEFWERISVKAYMTMNNLTDDTRKWVGSKSDLDEHVKEFPWVSYITYYEPTVQQTIFVQDVEMSHQIDPFGSKERNIPFAEYPHVLVYGDFNPDVDRFELKFMGIARTLRDSQREENKRKSQMFSILDSAPNGGYIVKNGAVSNIDDLYQADISVITLEDAAQMTDLKEMRPRVIPESTMALSQQLKQDLVELGGGSEEFMGTADLGNSQISGTLAKVRASNTVETLQDIFDNLNFAQELLGGKLLKYVRINFTAAHIKRITGKDIPEGFFQEEVEKFDITVAEGMLTDTNRNLAYVQSLQAREIGINVPERFIIENMPIANRSELMKAYEEQQKTAEQQQQKLIEQEDMAKRLGNAEIVHKLSLAEQQRKRAVADEGLAIERISESKLNQAKTEGERIDAVLGQIQAIKEMQGMDLERMQSAVRFILEIYEGNRQEEIAQHNATRGEIENDEMQGLIEMNYTDELRNKTSKTAQQQQGIAV